MRIRDHKPCLFSQAYQVMHPRRDGIIIVEYVPSLQSFFNNEMPNEQAPVEFFIGIQCFRRFKIMAGTF